MGEDAHIIARMMTNLCPDEHIIPFYTLKMPFYCEHYVASDLRVTFTKNLKKTIILYFNYGSNKIKE